MASKWPIVTLQEACETITDGAHASPKDHPGGLPMASVKDMARWGIDVTSSRTIAPEDFEFLVRNGCQPQIGDVLVAKDGATCLDTVCEFKQPDKIVLLSSVAILRPSAQLRSGYLRYYLDCADTRAMLKAGYVSGSAIPRVVLKDFRRAPIPLPSLAIQDRIAHILGTLDDKIELNRRMNATLEEMARALFKSWFVDFDPVRAKMAGKQPAGMDAETAALFPDAFEESELGEVPSCWDVKTLGEVVELAYGKPLKAEDRKDGCVCVYGSNGPVGWHNEKLVSGPGIVVGRKGNPGVVTWAHDDFYPIDTTFYVDPIGPCRSLYFLYYALSQHNLASLSADSAVPGLNRNHAYMSKQVIPSQHVLTAFDTQVAPIFASINANEEQSRTLATLRDTLLPKLLSGEISVADAEAEAGKGCAS